MLLEQPRDKARAGGFRLVRYFTLTGLVAFVVVAAALSYLERQESVYFGEVQRDQLAFVTRLQETFARQHDESARRDLLLAHEAEHVNLARLLANALWDSHFERFLARARRATEPCRRLATIEGPAAGTKASPALLACYADVRGRIVASREMRALDAKFTEAMRNTSVFKIKLFDENGLTIYSSEHAQIGEDKRSNEGWYTAIAGRPASELTHRDKFSAFERVVEDRDLISSYVPLFAPSDSSIIGVFEIYSDVTPLLAKMRSTSAEVAALAAANQAKLREIARSNQRSVDTSSYVVVSTVAGLLAALYVVFLLLARRAQSILDAQARAQEQSIRREERLHSEKMSVLATMAATVGHEIGNPLATITAVAEEMVERQASGAACGCRADVILEQTRRIAAKTRQMEDFSAARGEYPEPVDVNHVVKTVCEFLSFDRRFAQTAIEFRPAAELPARTLIADHLTEAVMNLLQAQVDIEDGRRPPARIVVETRTQANDVLISMSCDLSPASEAMAAMEDPRLASTRRRLAGCGATFSARGAVCEIALPTT